MKRMMILTSVLLAIATMTVAAPGGHAPGHRGPHGEFGSDASGPGHLLRIADEIKLTDQQKEKLENMLVEFKMEKIDLTASMDKAKVVMKALMHREDAPEREVMDAIDDLSSRKSDLMKMRYTHKKAVKALLTDEQTAKLKELRKARRKKMRHSLPGGEGPDHSLRPGRRGRFGRRL